MKNEPVYNEELHFEHRQWKRELDFWKDELKTFKHRLEELYKRWSDKHVLIKLDYFENRFQIHSDKIRAFKQRIYSHELNISRHYESGEVAIDRVSYAYHVDLRDQIQVQREMYHGLKKEFFAFISEAMKSKALID